MRRREGFDHPHTASDRALGSGAVVTRSRALAHLSDLHVGRSAQWDARAEALCRTLLDVGTDHLVVTGDVTHRGRREELARFRRIFSPFADRGGLTVVPGNHDRMGEDAAAEMAGDRRLRVERPPGLHLVCFDSTGPHNRSLLASQGLLTEEDVAGIAESFANRAPGALAVLLLHHHLLPLPHDNNAERVFSWLGWSSAEELPLGRLLVERLRGRCDLVLHGHRHDPAMATVFADDPRPLAILNAGSSTELGQARVFLHTEGRPLPAPLWIPGHDLQPRSVREHIFLHQAAPASLRA